MDNEIKGCGLAARAVGSDDHAPYVPRETCGCDLPVLWVWLGVWSAAWLAGVYFFSTETPALFGGFLGCVAGGLAADLAWRRLGTSELLQVGSERVIGRR